MPIPKSTIPPVTSALLPKILPHQLPRYTPRKQIKKVITPIIRDADTTETAIVAKVMPTAKASILVAIARIKSV